MSVAQPAVEEQLKTIEETPVAPAAAPVEKKEGKKSPEPEIIKTDGGDLEEQCDMTGKILMGFLVCKLKTGIIGY